MYKKMAYTLPLSRKYYTTAYTETEQKTQRWLYEHHTHGSRAFHRLYLLPTLTPGPVFCNYAGLPAFEQRECRKAVPGLYDANSAKPITM